MIIPLIGESLVLTFNFNSSVKPYLNFNIVTNKLA